MAAPKGPVLLTAASVAAVLRPIESAWVLEAGFWGERQELVRAASLPHAWERLEASGRLENFAPGSLAGDTPYRGDSYADSDVYKMLEASLWDSGRAAGSSLADRVHHVVGLVQAAQRPDGYLHTWFQRPDSPAPYSDMQMGHELYCVAHLIQAAIAGVRTGADSGLMAVATRAADHLVSRFSDPELLALCGHPLVEMALLELYRSTGNPEYRDLAGRMINARGHDLLGPGLFGGAYYQDTQPVRDTTSPVGHCVRSLYLAGGASDLFLETGEPQLLSALTDQWDALLAEKSYITGGVGCRRKDEAFGAPYELPPDHAFAETCAGVAQFMWGWRMLLATGSSVFADAMERLLFNLLPAALSSDGTAFAYINTLHKRGDSPEFGDKRTRRQEWFRCPCCPPNLMRLIASLGHYALTRDEDGIQVHQYLAGRATVAVPGGGTATLRVQTNYPHDGRVVVTIVDTPDGEWALSLRMPTWCDEVTLSVAGRPVPAVPDARGYLTVQRCWSPGTQLHLEFAMPAHLVFPDQRIDAVRGCAAVQRGPVVHCLEEQDSDAPIDIVVLSADAAATMVTLDDGGILVEALTADRHSAPWPYHVTCPSAAGPPSLHLRLQPYYAWGNRDESPMRVWLPTAMQAPVPTADR